MKGGKLLVSALIAISFGGAVLAAEPAELAATVPALSSFKPATGQSVCRGAEGYAGDFGGRRTFVWRPECLKQIKTGSDASKAPMEALLANARKVLQRAPYSVVDKQKVPASGDRHDYYSMGPYWWPTPGKPNGEPYSRRDGSINPERDGKLLHRRLGVL